MTSLITELRKFRIFNIALFDLIGSVIGIFILLKITMPNKPLSFYISWTILITMPISVLSHIITNTPTTFNYYLGLSNKPT